MSFKIKARITRELFHRDDYYILACQSLESNREIKLNQYGGFTIVGNLGYLTVDNEYELVVKEGKATKYGINYEVADCPSLAKQELDKLSAEEKFSIMKVATSSDRIARNVLTAYPNFIDDVVMKSDEELDKIIDLKNIKGVGEVYYKAYKRILRDKFQYFSYIHREELKPYDLSIDDAKKIFEKWSNPEESVKRIIENPYFVMIEVCGQSFKKVDGLLKTIRSDLIDSDERCEAVVMDILHRNEEDSDSRLNGNTCYRIMRDEYNCENLKKRIVNVCENSPNLYYDKESKDLSLFTTYMKEVNIASYAKSANKNCVELDFNVEDYRTLDNGITLTDEQLKAVENFKKYNFSIIEASAGCVDKDTEYFNGTEWKKICDYTDGENVLQFDITNNIATLTKPIRYIKEPCDKMYHFETKYGLDQTLSPEHIILLDHSTRQGNHTYITMTAEELKTAQENNQFNSVYNKFPTTFNYSGNGIDLTDNEIKIMCAVICDGSFYYNENDYPDRPSYMRCRFHIKKERKKIALRQLFTESGIWWEEKLSQAKGYSDFYINAPRREKEFLSYWYNCNHHQLEIICNNILQWDGYINQTLKGKIKKTFSTNSKLTADFIQFAFTACGYRSSIRIDDRRGKTHIANGKEYKYKSVTYELHFSNRTLPSIATHLDKNTTPTKFETIIPIDGYKYCFQMPSEYLVLRRNNKIFITHNCGKSTSAKAIVEACKKNNLTITIVAPTGVSALRISETTNHPASTIHLKCLRDREINTDCLLVDEASMPNLDTWSMLFQCITNPNIRIVLIGNYEQLPPIGVGTVYADLVKSGVVPVTSFTKVFRYGDSGIAYANTNTRQGIDFFNHDVIKHNGNTLNIMNDWSFIQKDSDEEIAEEIVNQYRKLIKQGVKKDDIMVLTAYNVLECGSYNLNNIIQAEFNPPIKGEKVFERKISGYGKITFRKGDIVINKKNNYSALPYDSWKQIEESNGILSEDEVETTMIFNGQKGVVVDVLDKVMVVKFDEELIVFDKLQVYNLLLGTVQSLHSCQGSESKYVICAITESQSRLLNKNLLYVANSRAKVKHINIGQIKAYQDALKIDGVNIRNTWLLDLLTENIEEKTA